MVNLQAEEAVIKNYKFSFLIFLLAAVFASPVQGQDRGSIPEELLRPGWGEAPRYPSDMVIGELGQGRASAAAFNHASSVASALLSRQRGHSSLSNVNPAIIDSYLSALGRISPVSFRLGGGREEADGSVSFLIRYIGREYGMTGELYIRYITKQVVNENGETIAAGSWVFDDLLFEEARSREEENQDALQRAQNHRLNYMPYERFF
ncbi:MAG: hypothetical protein FWC19_03615 [Treponema sp.]|nr:hypothetical protein [Treponema sp.]MCL2271878.1 hypothetical protein [Treponema sp.]